MLLYLAVVTAFYIKTIELDKYFGVDETLKIGLVDFKDALVFDLTTEYDSPRVFITNVKYNYIKVNKEELHFFNIPSYFDLIYSFNGGFLIRQDDLCVTFDYKDRISLKNCNGHFNKFIIINNSSIEQGDEYKLRYFGNTYRTYLQADTKPLYKTMTPNSLILRFENYSSIYRIDDSLEKQRDFVKVNHF